MRPSRLPLPAIIIAWVVSASALAAPPEGLQRSDRPYAVSRPLATGRAGTANVEARALIGKDAVGLIEATTASLDSGGSPSGSLTELQIKAYSSGNAIALTLNRTLDQASFQETTTGLYHGQ